jgi:putative iron-only hydrogenase system regulator
MMMADPINILGIMVDNRAEVAPELQEVITRYGSGIICRMGVPSPSKKKGLITLVFEGELAELVSFREELSALPGVLVQTISFPQ